MGPFVVVAREEGIEAGLLVEEVGGRGPGGFGLQGQMHPLVAAVLLGVARLDAFDGDAEPSPPHRQPAQPIEGVRAGEGNAIVGSDGPRQAKVLEGPFKHDEGIAFLGGGERVTGDEVAAREVGDGQRIAVAAVAEHELALVVGTPEFVGRRRPRQRRPPGFVAAAPSAPHQTMPVEDSVDGADGRARQPGIPAPEPIADLGRSPMGILPLEPDNQRLDLQRELVGMPIGPPAPVRLVFDHEHQHDSQWAAIRSVAAKIGCTSETLRHWVRQVERDTGRRPGLTTDERAQMKELDREVRELRRANEILRKASAFFAQAELDRRPR